MPTMKTRSTTRANRARTSHRRAWPWIAAPAVLTGLVLLAAGCGGGSPHPAVAQATTSPATTSAQPSARGDGSQNAAGRQGALAFASCMRKNGIPSFPDPNSQGTFLLTPGSGVDPSSHSFQAAMQACQKLAPGGTPAQAAQAPAKALKFARCMRSHGVPNFPDPKVSGGNFQVQLPSGVSQNSPQFQKAIRACQSLSPLPGGGGSGSGSSINP
jgi:hypothetical protein